MFPYSFSSLFIWRVTVTLFGTPCARAILRMRTIPGPLQWTRIPLSVLSSTEGAEPSLRERCLPGTPPGERVPRSCLTLTQPPGLEPDG